MGYVLSHVKFEGGLSISGIRNEATTNKKLELEIKKFLKKSNVSEPACPLYFNPCCAGHDLSHVRAFQNDR
jgi:hypothetical protein